MRVQVAVILWLCALLAGCGGSSQNPIVGGNPIAPPVITSTAAQNGGVIVSITPGVQYAQIHYTTDGSTPVSASQFYQGPFLVASNLTVKAIDILVCQRATLRVRHSRRTSHRERWSGAMISRTIQGQTLSPTPLFGYMTPGRTAAAITNWKTIAHGIRR